jgi:hypothetical protein
MRPIEFKLFGHRPYARIQVIRAESYLMVSHGREVAFAEF